jgi:DNA-binding winged helix-turn-helix (wHTH) protein
VAGQPLDLTNKEYEILEFLLLCKGATLTKKTILKHLYGGVDEPKLRIIDVFICQLRKKLAAASGGETYIETFWGRGYVMRDTVVTSENEDQPVTQMAAAQRIFSNLFSRVAVLPGRRFLLRFLPLRRKLATCQAPSTTEN